MRRPVFAKADGIMGQHMDDANAHQRGEADRGAAVIGEDEERAAIRDEAAVQTRCRSWPRPCRIRERRNECSGRKNPSGVTAFMSAALVLLEPVRSADPPIRLGCAGASLSSSFCDEMRVACAAPPSLAACLERFDGGGDARRDRAADVRARTALSSPGRAGEARPTRGRARRRRGSPPRPRPCGCCRGFRRAHGSSRRSRGRPRSHPCRAPRHATACGPGFGRRAKSDRRLAGDQRPACRPLCAACERGGDRFRVMAVDARGRPAGGLEARQLIDRIRERAPCRRW